MDFDYYVESLSSITSMLKRVYYYGRKKKIFIQLTLADLCKKGSKLSSCSWGFKKKECKGFTPNNIT